MPSLRQNPGVGPSRCGKVRWITRSVTGQSSLVAWEASSPVPQGLGSRAFTLPLHMFWYWWLHRWSRWLQTPQEEEREVTAPCDTLHVCWNAGSKSSISSNKFPLWGPCTWGHLRCPDSCHHDLLQTLSRFTHAFWCIRAPNCLEGVAFLI